MTNSNLTKAKDAKNDEFYTQYHDIEREMNAYLDYDPDVFRGKTVLLPCDDPEWSNFTKYFAARFEHLGLKKLISTSYAPQSKHRAEDLFSYQPTDLERNSARFDADKALSKGKLFVLTEDMNKDGRIDIKDIGWSYLEGTGDFRTAEVKALRDEADIVITNPPFSLFREYMAWITEAGKRFVVIANKNCITYKELFPLIKDNQMWVGKTPLSQDILFTSWKAIDPREFPSSATKIVDGVVYLRSPSVWFTNIEHGRRHQPLSLMTMKDNLKFNKKMKGKAAYDRYDNYDAIDVPFTNAIPSDYGGVMGVPISFLDKYCPEQFEIVGTSDRGGDGKIEHLKLPHARYDAPVVNGNGQYKRIFIRHVKQKPHSASTSSTLTP